MTTADLLADALQREAYLVHLAKLELARLGRRPTGVELRAAFEQKLAEGCPDLEPLPEPTVTVDPRRGSYE